VLRFIIGLVVRPVHAVKHNTMLSLDVEYTKRYPPIDGENISHLGLKMADRCFSQHDRNMLLSDFKDMVN